MSLKLLRLFFDLLDRRTKALINSCSSSVPSQLQHLPCPPPSKLLPCTLPAPFLFLPRYTQLYSESTLFLTCSCPANVSALLLLCSGPASALLLPCYCPAPPPACSRSYPPQFGSLHLTTFFRTASASIYSMPIQLFDASS